MRPDGGLGLFPEEDGSRGENSRGEEAVGAENGPGSAPIPLAARMRPRSLEEFRGQKRLLEPGKMLWSMLDRGEVTSMIFWGPPGSGKTTLARLLAQGTDAAFEAFSAVTQGVGRVREIIGQAQERLRGSGRKTILFCDEIHRFNKAQQDAFLPFVEDGTIVLIGATTENPSFEVVRPLLSRAPVFVLEPLSESELEEILEWALLDGDRGLGSQGLECADGALALMAREADGDARRALGILEGAAALVGSGGRLDSDVVREAAQLRFAVYDKSGEEHFNLISALHKAVRGSDPNGALYWLARMLTGGEDPLYIARRLVRMATEDIGLSDPSALQVALSARDAYHFLGSPEGELALAEATVYLSTAPKSNRAYVAWKEAQKIARDTPGAAVPLHIRNAPTSLMKGLGYGAGYRYDHDEPHGVASAGISSGCSPRDVVLSAQRVWTRGHHTEAVGLVGEEEEGCLGEFRIRIRGRRARVDQGWHEIQNGGPEMQIRSKACLTSGIKILGALALALVQGCVSFTPPAVEVLEVELVAVGLTEGQVEVTLGVANEGRRDLNVKGIIYELQLNTATEGVSWVTLSDGFFDEAVSVPRGQRQGVTIPVSFEYRALGEAIRAFLSRGEVPYRLTGEVWVGGPSSGLQLPFRRQGILGS